jgi:diguanylate cyclase (GGDEF)-like protein
MLYEKNLSPVKENKSLILNLQRLAQQNPQKLVTLYLKEREARMKAEELTEIDDITELLLNKRGWRRSTVELGLTLVSKDTSFSIFFVDLDRLKAVDDYFTNQHGTAYIKLFAEVLNDTLRTEDIKSHPQGDEFFVLLPGITLREAKRMRTQVVENFHKRVMNLPEDHFFYEVPKVCEVGASIGVAERRWKEEEREEFTSLKKDDSQRKMKALIKEVLKKANLDSDKIKHKKKVVRHEARSRSRIRRISSALGLLKTSMNLIHL